MADHIEETCLKKEVASYEKTSVDQKPVELSQVKDETYSDTPEYVQIDTYNGFDGRNYQCGECRTKFKDAEYLQIHLLVHESDIVPDSCQLCGFILDFSTEKSHRKLRKKYICHINKHIKEKMAKKKLQNTKCKFCGKVVTSANQLAIHLRVHTNERPYACTICDKSFKQLGSLKTHLDSHAPLKYFVCKLCNGSFSTPSSLRRHQRKIHDTGKSMVCSLCSQKFYNMTDIRNHRRIDHSQEVKTRNCLYCHMKFNSYSLYKKHIDTHADLQAIAEKNRIEKQVKKNTFKCQLCGDVFLDKQLKNSHINQHLQYSQKDYEDAKEKGHFACKTCSRIFNGRHSLFVHTSSHMAKIHVCEDCGKSYSYFSLVCHRRLVHMIFKCKMCKEVLIGGQSQRIHNIKYHHSQMKQYKCSMCSKVLISKYLLRNHYLISHNDSEEPHCNDCGKKFLTKFSLSAHKVHNRCHSIAKYECSFCDRAFKLQYNLKRHYRYVHENNKDYLFDVTRKAYICLICQTIKKDYRTLSNHIRIHKNFRKFRCKICMKFFNTRRTLDLHVKNEVCEKFLQKVRNRPHVRYECNKCSRPLKAKNYLLGHVVYHSVEYKKCRICGVEYKEVSHIKKHMKNKHPDEKIFRCGHCDVHFDKFQDMRLHLFSEEHKSRCGINNKSIEQHFRLMDIKSDKEENTEIKKEPPCD